ncbi:MAG: aspartate aminotransferase family protein [Magnetospiraceae bacterium]
MIDPVLPTYARFDLALERGEGVHVWSTDGRHFLDFAAGIAVTSLGHAHPKLVAALTEQAGKIWHCSNLFRIPGQEKLAKRLVDLSFGDTVFMTNSGVEAMECALKMARRYHDVTGNPDKYRVIAFEGAFHGRSLATIAAGGQEKHMEGFGPHLEGFDHVPFGNLNAVRAAITDQTGAILVEPIQGEGGINAAAKGFLQDLRQTADEFGLLLIYDEIQCGIGRTGKLFAYEWPGAAPDIMALAKGLGGGFPLGACVATENAAQGMTPGTHGSTYGGNPLACAVANTVLDLVLEDGFLDNVNKVAGVLGDELRRIAAAYPKVIVGVRGMGLMLGLKCAVPNGTLVKALLKNGLLSVGAADNVVRFLPPLILTEGQARQGAEILEKTCAELAA